MIDPDSSYGSDEREPGICLDARVRAADFVRRVRANNPLLAIFAYGSTSKISIGFGVEAGIAVFENGYKMSGGGEVALLPVKGSPWEIVERFLEDAKTNLRKPVYGYLGYELNYQGLVFDRPPRQVPDACLFVPECVVEFSSGNAQPVKLFGGRPIEREAPACDSSWYSVSLPDNAGGEIHRLAHSALDWIKNEPTEARRLTVSTRFPLSTSVRLESVLEAPIETLPIYRSFYASFPSWKLELAGNSPELLLLGGASRFSSFKLSGTYPRTAAGLSEGAAMRRMLADPKLAIEHEAAVSSFEQRLSEAGAVKRHRRDVVTLHTLHHFVTRLTITKRHRCSITELLRRAMPIGGVPSPTAIEAISTIEGVARGPYYGLLGCVYPSGGVDFTQVLRTAFRYGDQTFVQAGANFSEDSVRLWNIEDEISEIARKASSVYFQVNSMAEVESRAKDAPLIQRVGEDSLGNLRNLNV